MSIDVSNKSVAQRHIGLIEGEPRLVFLAYLLATCRQCLSDGHRHNQVASLITI